MRTHVSVRCVLACCCLVLMGSRQVRAADVNVSVDRQSAGRTFEGIGALSAGASSRLLLDYPQDVRSDILDLLFKPRFGASFHHLKLEIGGDVNSTDGTEPSHARTREEFAKPHRQHYERGYEWLLMREARRRNPSVFIDILQWGAPDWIGSGDVREAQLPPIDPALKYGPQIKERGRLKFFTQDNADFIAAFIEGADRYHGVRVDFCGIWNEMPWDNAWIKRLRSTLDRRGLSHVRIVAADQCGRRPWEIARDILADKELADAVYAVGAHYAGMMRKDEQGDDHFNSTPQARQTGKPLWASEDGPWRGDWSGAGTLARMFNRNYVRGRMTKTIIWSLVTSYYENLPIPNSGPMKANTPWSGHYEVQPAIWAIAHTTQFAQPGWVYLDSACGISEDGAVSFVTLTDPQTGDLSIVVEAIEAKQAARFKCKLPADLVDRPLHVWRTGESAQFERQADIVAADGSFTLTIEPASIYSITTTTGQQKGTTQIPPPAEFPLPYVDKFDKGIPGKYARYLSDQGGVFEIAPVPAPERGPGSQSQPARSAPVPGGNVLRQVIPRKGIEWAAHPTPEPYTVMGSLNWKNIEVACDALIEGDGYVAVHARVGHCPQSAAQPQGYRLTLDSKGRWELWAAARSLGSGKLPNSFDPRAWHNLKLRAAGPQISAYIDHQPIHTIEDFTSARGMIGLGTGWNLACFDNLSISPLDSPEWVNLAEGKAATGSSRWAEEYDARFAVDGLAGTRWNSQDGRHAGEWLEVDLGEPRRFDRLVAQQFAPRIRAATVQVSEDGRTWRDVHTFRARATELNLSAGFGPVQARYVRLRIDATDGQTPSIFELELYDSASRPRLSRRQRSLAAPRGRVRASLACRRPDEVGHILATPAPIHPGLRSTVIVKSF